MRMVRYMILFTTVFSLQLVCRDCRGENSGSGDSRYARERDEMVDEQIKARGVRDERVLAAMSKVERHRFVPDRLEHLAYADSPLPIGEGQTISQPYIVALMTELVRLEGDERVLEIGTGSGYQAAVLAELCGHVYTIEILEPLAARSEELLKSLGYENITVKCGDGFLGWEEFAPFDAIVVTCAPPDVPEPLVEQLKDGGRLVIPVGRLFQKLELIEKKGDKIETRDIIPVRFVPMLGRISKEK